MPSTTVGLVFCEGTLAYQGPELAKGLIRKLWGGTQTRRASDWRWGL